jgi:hypothetical protein
MPTDAPKDGSGDPQRPFDEAEPFRSLFQNPFFDMQGEAMRTMLAGALPSGSGT